MSEVAQKLPFKEKIFYGFGDLASVLYWQTTSLDAPEIIIDKNKIKTKDGNFEKT